MKRLVATLVVSLIAAGWCWYAWLHEPEIQPTRFITMTAAEMAVATPQDLESEVTCFLMTQITLNLPTTPGPEWWTTTPSSVAAICAMAAVEGSMQATQGQWGRVLLARTYTPGTTPSLEQLAQAYREIGAMRCANVVDRVGDLAGSERGKAAVVALGIFLGDPPEPKPMPEDPFVDLGKEYLAALEGDKVVDRRAAYIKQHVEEIVAVVR